MTTGLAKSSLVSILSAHLHMTKSTALCLALSVLPALADGPDFVKEIAPILKASCVKCHNNTKSKGKLNFETKEGAMKGGESGASIVPGKPTESLMVKSMELPDTDDDVMPPVDKAPKPTAEQIALIKKWIEAGAVWPDGVTIAPEPPKEAPAK